MANELVQQEVQANELVFQFELDLQVEEKDDKALINNKDVSKLVFEIELDEGDEEDEPAVTIRVSDSLSKDKWETTFAEGDSTLPDGMTAKQVFEKLNQVKGDRVNIQLYSFRNVHEILQNAVRQSQMHEFHSRCEMK